MCASFRQAFVSGLDEGFCSVHFLKTTTRTISETKGCLCTVMFVIVQSRNLFFLDFDTTYT